MHNGIRNFDKIPKLKLSVLVIGFSRAFSLAEGCSLRQPTPGNVLEPHVISGMAEHPRRAICSSCER